MGEKDKLEQLKKDEYFATEMTQTYHEAFHELVHEVAKLSQEDKDELLGDTTDVHNAIILYEQGLEFKKQGKFKKAFECFMKSSEQFELTRNLCEIGNCYYSGKGTRQSFRKAVQYYSQCIDWDNIPFAQYRYGLCLYEGTGIKKNEIKGISFLEDAGRKKVKEAILKLMEIYASDKEVYSYWKSKLN